MSTEKTLILVKPDGVARGLVGEVISRIEAKGYAISDDWLRIHRAILLHNWGGFDWSMGGGHSRGPQG